MLGDDADRLALQKASAFVEARWIDAPRLRTLIAGTAKDFGDVPDRGAPVDELVAYCANAPLPIGVALVREAYVHGGWAVAAATLVADVSWDLVENVSRAATARFVDDACRELEAGEPIAARLDAIGEPAPGRELSTTARARIIDAALADARAAPARARLAHALMTVDAVIAGTVVPEDAIERDVDRGPLVAWLAIDEPWTWASVDAWRHRDPLAPGKAIARAAGIAIAPLLDEVRIAIARELDGLAAIAWRRAIAAARAELPEAASSPIVDAILALADAATDYAARRLASEGPAVVGELLGDPRNCPDAWQGSAAAIRAAIGAP
jgi:hypothetical protein